MSAERARPEAAEGERPQPKPASAEKRKPAASEKGDEPSLAELLLGLLTKGENEDPDAPPPRIQPRGLLRSRGRKKQRRAGL